MEAIELLQTTGVMVQYQDKWLIYDSTEWNVYHHKPCAKHTTCLYRGTDLDKAIELLVGINDARG